MKTSSLTTGIVHSDRHFGVEHGGLRKPVHTSVQYGFERTEDLIGVFQGSLKNAWNYARQGTPTSSALESMINRMEGGQGTICFTTGMAGICAIFLTLLRAGDHLVCSKHVFGNTNSVLGTLEDLGIAVSRVNATVARNVADALRPETRMVFVETIANPGTQVPDLAAIGALCAERGLVYVVDNTITSPALFQPRSVGASLVVNSLTKTIGGHGSALGGSVTDTGLFGWGDYPNIFAGYRKGDPAGWGLQQLRKKGLRDMGAALAPEAAHRISQGAETLELRIRRCSDSALALAHWLQRHPAVQKVHYPGLPEHPQHAIARQHFQAASWLMSFELRHPERLVGVLDRLKLVVKSTGLGDTRTLVIPVAPTIFWEAGAEARAEMGITDGLIRVSLGLEAIDDLIADFEQALRAA